LAAEVSERELAARKALLKTRGLKGPHLEIGTAAGGTLKELMRCYADAERPRFVVVDPMRYFPDQPAIVRKNLASAGLDPKQVDFRIARSWLRAEAPASDSRSIHRRLAPESPRHRRPR
jgi:hypothetical protein